MGTQQVTTKGFAELDALLEELPDNIARNATRRGMKQGSDVMAAEQRRLAPGGLRDTIVIKAKARNLTGLSDYGAVLAGGGSYRDASAALRAARREGGSEGTRMTLVIGSSAPHAHLVERGTGERFHKSGKSVGVMPAQPFIRPAWDSKWPQMLTAVRDAITEAAMKAKTRLAKKAARND